MSDIIHYVRFTRVELIKFKIQKIGVPNSAKIVLKYCFPL